MRTIVNGASKVGCGFRVKVEDYAGSWIDISHRLKSISGGDDLESDSATVTLVFRNAYNAYVNVSPNVNLDPLDESSDYNLVGAVYHPLLARYNAITVEITKDEGAHWYQIFSGFVGPGQVSVDTDLEGDDLVTVKPVDKSYTYKDDYWYDSMIYKDADAVSIMGQMFTDRGFNQTVIEADAPGFHVEEIETGQVNLWEAQQKLIEPTGFIYRMAWNAGAGTFKPTVYDPERDNTTPDWVCDGEFNRRRIDIDESDVRTQIVIIYRERNTGAMKRFSLENATALANFGIPDGYGGRKHKTMWYVVQGTGKRYSQVDTAGEAETLAGYISNDLSEPAPDIEISLPYVHPGVEVHDVISAVGNDYTTLIGVMSYTWSVDVENAVGEMTIKGSLDRVVGQYKRWLARDTRSEDAATAAMVSFMNGDGLTPAAPETITARSYMGYDAALGKMVPMVVLNTETAGIWDFSAYVWQWWIKGQTQVHTETTTEPVLVITGLPEGSTVVAQVSIQDWSR